MIGSGDPRPLYNYSDGITRTWHGRAQIILIPRDPSGQITLTVTSEHGLQKKVVFDR